MCDGYISLQSEFNRIEILKKYFNLAIKNIFNLIIVFSLNAGAAVLIYDLNGTA